MRPVRTDETNTTFQGPPGVGDLPVFLAADTEGVPAIRSTWALEPEERAAIAAGANVALTVWIVQCPVRLEVVDLPGVGDDAPDVRDRLRVLRAQGAERANERGRDPEGREDECGR